jgi:predicted dehydrogenase
MNAPATISPPARPLDIVMVGCGAFAHRYHIPAIDEDPTLRIVEIVDPTPSPATRALAGRFGAPLHASIDADAFPADRSHDRSVFAIVTTPHTLHAAHIDAVLDRGWPVLVDKPFVMHEVDAVRLAKRADQLGLHNAVAYNRRFDRNCLRARQWIREGRIGTPRFVQTVQLGYERAGWFLVPALGGGGPYTGRATHMADLLPWLLDRPATRVRSRLRSSSADRSDHGGFIELQFDTLECQMTCIEEGWHMWDEVRVFGDEGLIELRRPLTIPIGWTLECLIERMVHRETFEADARPGDATRNFVDALRGRGEVECTFAQATPSVRLVEAAFVSAREDGRWIELR